MISMEVDVEHTMGSMGKVITVMWPLCGASCHMAYSEDDGEHTIFTIFKWMIIPP